VVRRSLHPPGVPFSGLWTNTVVVVTPDEGGPVVTDPKSVVGVEDEGASESLEHAVVVAVRATTKMAVSTRARRLIVCTSFEG